MKKKRGRPKGSKNKKTLELQKIKKEDDQILIKKEDDQILGPFYGFIKEETESELFDTDKAADTAGGLFEDTIARITREEAKEVIIELISKIVEDDEIKETKKEAEKERQDKMKTEEKDPEVENNEDIIIKKEFSSNSIFVRIKSGYTLKSMKLSVEELPEDADGDEDDS